MNCLLCHTESFENEDKVFECSHCGLVFKNPSLHLDSNEDLKRYSTHQNNENDQGYIDFLNRLITPMTPFLPKEFSGLDFGCGPGPTISQLMKKLGGSVLNYDPLFFPNLHLLNQKYEVVTSTEVVEHFKLPSQNWGLLINLVRPGGILGIMTQFITLDTNYKSWWYKNDPTHIVFYSEKTFQYLSNQFNLEILFNDKKSVVIFKKK